MSDYREKDYKPSEHRLPGPYGPAPNIIITLQDFKRFADSHTYMLEFCAEVCGTTTEKFCEFDKMKFRKKLMDAMEIIKLCAYSCQYNQVCDHEYVEDRCSRCQAKDFLNASDVEGSPGK